MQSQIHPFESFWAGQWFFSMLELSSAGTDRFDINSRSLIGQRPMRRCLGQFENENADCNIQPRSRIYPTSAFRNPFQTHWHNQTTSFVHHIHCMTRSLYSPRNGDQTLALALPSNATECGAGTIRNRTLLRIHREVTLGHART